MWRLGLACGVGLLAGGCALGQSAEARCAALASVKLDGAVVTSAAVVSAGAAMAGVELKAKGLPAICRVRVQDKPSADSVTLVEVWLPLAGWDGKLHGIGNGGLRVTSISIRWPRM